MREYLKTPQARLQLTSMWGSNENELPDLHVCSGGWNWVKRHIEASIDSRFINLLEDWEKEECIIPELEAKLCCEAKLELCELEAELSQIEKTVQLDKSSKGSSANFENTFKESVANFATFEEDDEDQKQMSNKLRRMIGAIFKPFNSENKKEKKLKKYMKDSVGVAKHMAEKKLKALQQDKDTLRTFITELLQRPFNYIHHLETKIPNMIKSNEMILNKFEQEILLDAASRYQYTDMMIRIESIRRGLLEYGESYLFANDFDADDVQLVNVVSDKQICRRDSVKDLVKRGSTSEDMELLQSPYGLWTSGMLFIFAVPCTFFRYTFLCFYYCTYDKNRCFELVGGRDQAI